MEGEGCKRDEVGTKTNEGKERDEGRRIALETKEEGRSEEKEKDG